MFASVMEKTRKLVGKSGQEYLLFDSGYCPLSTYYPSKINVYDVQYRSCQQFYQALKCKHFGDVKAYTMIMKTFSPKTQAEIASTIEGFDPEVWEKKAEGVMERALRLKFSQNENLKNMLLGTGNANIIFATKYQTYWGSGLAINDDANGEPTCWVGNNKLGQLLMKIREEFKVVNHAQMK